LEIDLTRDQRLLLESTQSFLEREGPIHYVRNLHERGLGVDVDWWRRGAELGWTAMLVPEEFGGGSVSGNGLQDAAIVAELMGRFVSPGPLVAANVVAVALAEAENAGQFVDLLTAIVAGETIPSWAGPHVSSVRAPQPTVRAERRGGAWVLSGTVGLVEAADQAATLLVFADGDGGWRQFVVPTDSSGVEITPLTSLDLTRHFASVDLRQVMVGADSLVVPAGDAAAAVERQLQVAVALQCAETMGAVDRVVEFTIQWMFDRYTFGRALASYQALKHRIADAKLHYEAGQAATAAAVKAVQGRSAEAAQLVSTAKSYVGQHATDVIQDCVQLHGGMGVTWEHDLHLYLRRATVNRNTWGTPGEHLDRIADLIGI
jgi:alkylation response protein AidB-like acyl-CoA dehydrogenase